MAAATRSADCDNYAWYLSREGNCLLSHSSLRHEYRMRYNLNRYIIFSTVKLANKDTNSWCFSIHGIMSCFLLIWCVCPWKPAEISFLAIEEANCLLLLKICFAQTTVLWESNSYAYTCQLSVHKTLPNLEQGNCWKKKWIPTKLLENVLVLLIFTYPLSQ